MISRYISHHRLDADQRALLLEAVTQFQILSVGVYTMIKHFSLFHFLSHFVEKQSFSKHKLKSHQNPLL